MTKRDASSLAMQASSSLDASIPGAPMGRARGAHARAAKLSPERRREIAQIAARARWAKVRRPAPAGSTDHGGAL
jgi:hypothetical protein